MTSLREWLVEPLIHLSAWIAGYQGTHLLLAGTSSVAAYASLSAWWLALYAGYVLSVKLKACVPLFIGYLIVSGGSLWLGYEWFFHDPPESLGLWLLVIAGGQALIFVSPVVINFLVRKIGVSVE